MTPVFAVARFALPVHVLFLYAFHDRMCFGQGVFEKSDVLEDRMRNKTSLVYRLKVCDRWYKLLPDSFKCCRFTIIRR